MVAYPAYLSAGAAGADSRFHCQFRYLLGTLSVSLTPAASQDPWHLGA
jgi:hypothetical protein